MEIFVADTNFFIQAHRLIYPLDIAFSYWNKVKQLAEQGKIISIDKVKNELYDKNESIERWCKANLPEDFFRDTSHVMDKYGMVSSWAISKSNHYLPNALNEFLSADVADAFLIAFALEDPNSRIIVTYETSEPLRRSKVKIPDVCIGLNVTYVNTIEMFRKLGETF
jgi:hypothetical protein